jgi:hypothetical protein
MAPAGVGAEVPVLDRLRLDAEINVLAVRQKPDRVDLGSSVRTDRGQVSEGFTTKDVSVPLRYFSCGHAGLLLPSCSGPRRRRTAEATLPMKSLRSQLESRLESPSPVPVCCLDQGAERISINAIAHRAIPNPH